MRKLLVLVVLVSIAEAAVAQSFYAIRKNRSLIAVVGAGTATYFGELSNPGDYFDAKPGLSAGMQYYLTPQLSIRSDLTFFTMEGTDAKADDAGRTSRNLSFKSNNLEFNVAGAFNLFPNGDRYYRRPYYNVYGFAGLGFLYFNPTAEYQGKKYALQPLNTEGADYSRFTLVIPYGIGVRFKAGPNFNVALEGGFRKVFTDYLDDVSTVYLDNSSFTNPIAQALADRRPEIGKPINAAGKQRGNPGSDDGYMLLSVKLEYYLPFDLHDNGNGRMYSRKRSASYRYNKRGGLRR
ncbi:MAG: outer membrane beta-barrel protein [Cytophagales bacterium]|nr:outer membrane beta-barrel protein [Cytophagales bacterium]